MADYTEEQLAKEAARFERYDLEDMEEDDGAGRGPQRRSLPTVKDPRIWKISCKVKYNLLFILIGIYFHCLNINLLYFIKAGEERRVVCSLMNRCMEKEIIGSPLKIHSAFCTDHVTGYIFIEARHFDDIKKVGRIF